MIALISWLGWNHHKSIREFYVSELEDPPILAQIDTLQKHHSVPKIQLYVGTPHSISHHFGLILEHYHPLFTLITQETQQETLPKVSGKIPVMAIVLEHHIPPSWEEVIKLYNAELLLVSNRKSYLNSIQDLKGTGLILNTGPVGSFQDQLGKSLLKIAGIEIGSDVHVTNYLERDIVELFGYGIDLFFSFTGTPDPLVNQLSMRLPITLLNLKLGPINGLREVHLSMEKHRKYYAHLDNFIHHHIWSYTMPYVMIAPVGTSPEIRGIMTETIHDLLPVLEKLPYWDLPEESGAQGLPGIPNPQKDSVSAFIDETPLQIHSATRLSPKGFQPT